jgi:hypothetical protein
MSGLGTRDAVALHDNGPRRTVKNAFSLTASAHGANLPPFRPRPEVAHEAAARATHRPVVSRLPGRAAERARAEICTLSGFEGGVMIRDRIHANYNAVRRLYFDISSFCRRDEQFPKPLS